MKNNQLEGFAEKKPLKFPSNGAKSYGNSLHQQEMGMAHEANKAFLKRVSLFSGLGERQLDTLAAASVRRTFSRGRLIVAEGESSQAMYILLSGRAKVQRSDSEGKEVILAVLGPGECFGEMSLIDDAPRSASVITLESSDFMAINKEAFLAVLGENPEIAMKIMRGLVKRLREADRKIETLALLDVYGRVARVLLDFSEDIKGQRVIRGRLPRQEIAKMIGASREMVSRVMKGLEKEGYIGSDDEGRLVLREKLSSYLQ
jgi:CRP/FNR family cyclic AMP-dependent transcriptional regulator